MAKHYAIRIKKNCQIAIKINQFENKNIKNGILNGIQCRKECILFGSYTGVKFGLRDIAKSYVKNVRSKAKIKSDGITNNFIILKYHKGHNRMLECLWC